MDITTIFKIISIAVTAIFALIIVISAIRGMKRGIISTGWGLLRKILCAFLAVLATRGLSSFIAGKIASVDILSGIDKENSFVLDLLKAVNDDTELGNVLPGLVLAVMAPVIFLTLYYIIDAIVAIIMSIIWKHALGPVAEKANINKPADKILGCVLGAASAFIAISIFLVPTSHTVYYSADRVAAFGESSLFTGGFSIPGLDFLNGNNKKDEAPVNVSKPEAKAMSSSAAKTEETKEETEDKKEVNETASEIFKGLSVLSRNPLFRFTCSVTDPTIRRNIMVFDTPSGKIYLADEEKNLSEISSIMSDISSGKITGTDATKALGEALENSETLAEFVSDTIRDLCSSKDIRSIVMSKAPASLEKLLDQVFEIGSKSKPGTLKNDLAAVASLFSIFNNILLNTGTDSIKDENGNIDSAKFLTEFLQSDQIGTLTAAIYDNEAARDLAGSLISDALNDSISKMSPERERTDFTVDLSSMTKEEAVQQMTDLSKAASEIINLSSKISPDAMSGGTQNDFLANLSDEELTGLGNALDVLKENKLTKEAYGALVDTIVENDALRNSGISEDTIREVLVSNEISTVNYLNSLGALATIGNSIAIETTGIDSPSDITTEKEEDLKKAFVTLAKSLDEKTAFYIKIDIGAILDNAPIDEKCKAFVKEYVTEYISVAPKYINGKEEKAKEEAKAISAAYDLMKAVTGTSAADEKYIASCVCTMAKSDALCETVSNLNGRGSTFDVPSSLSASVKAAIREEVEADKTISAANKEALYRFVGII